MAVAFTFPGQGSQHIGMGAELAQAFTSAREVFEEVDDALSQNLSQLCWHGEAADLMLTENAQPALMAVSLAVLSVLQNQVGVDMAKSVKFVAGHSLGEYSALAAASALKLADTARLLKIRGLAMQRAVPVGEGAMAALLGLDLAVVEQVLHEGGDGAQVANDNAPGQVVISGAKSAVEDATQRAREAGARRCIPLPVSAPFHCALMQPAAEVMGEALQAVEMAAPSPALVSNVTAQPVRQPDDIRARLVEQVTGMVRWRETVLYMADNEVSRLYEIGAGKVLTGLAKRIGKDIEALSCATPEDIEKVAATW